jgi:hypothetical protein
MTVLHKKAAPRVARGEPLTIISTIALTANPPAKSYLKVLSKRSVVALTRLMLCKSYELPFRKFAELPENVNPLA